MYSATKYIGGHGTSIGGVVVDGGNFDWEAHPARQPALNTPDPSYHGAVWTQAVKPLGPIAYILKARVTLLRDLGAAMSPFNAFLFLQGIETLALRMREHSRNALAVANFLAGRKDVTRVIHPSHLTRRAARSGRRNTCRTARAGWSASSWPAARRPGGGSSTRCKMFYHVANIGDARSLAIHPASTTHSQLTQAGTGGDRRDARLCAAVDRDRAHRRHPRRSVAGAGCGWGCAGEAGGGIGNQNPPPLWVGGVFVCFSFNHAPK